MCRLYRSLKPPGVLLRKEALGHDGVEVHAQAGHQDGHDQRDRLVCQNPLQRMPVRRQEVVEEPLAGAIENVMPLVRWGWPQEFGTHRRRRRQRHQERNSDRNAQRDRELAKQPPYNSAHHQQRDEHCHEGQAHGEHSEADFRRSLERRLHRVHPMLHVAHDVFQNHDGVIHHEPSRNRQRHERQIIQAVAQQIHAPESAHQRKRHCNAGNQGRPHRPQEHEHHQNHQHDRNQQRGFNVFNRGTDRNRAVRDNCQFDSRRNRRLEIRHQSAHAIHGLDDVRAGLPENNDQNPGFAICQAEVVHVRHRVLHIRHVSQSHRGAVMIGDYQRAVLVRGKKLIIVGELLGDRSVRYLSLGLIGVGQIQRVAHRVQAHSELVEQHRIDFDSHGRRRRTVREHLAHSIHLRKLLRQNRVGRVIQTGHRNCVRSERQNQDGSVRGVDLAIGRIARQIGRKLAARGIDGRLHIASSGINVPVQIKLQRDAGRAQLARRGHLVHARDASELPLQRRGHCRSHRLRVGAWQRCANADHRKIHSRQRSHRQ